MKKKQLLLALSAFVLIVSGIYNADLQDAARTATYGNFDVPGQESWVMKLHPGIADLASSVEYGEFHAQVLIAVGLLFVLTFVFMLMKRKQDMIKRLLVQWLSFVIARLGVLRTAGVCPVKRTQLGIFPFLNCQACEMATGACPIGMLQWQLMQHRFPSLVIGILVLSGVLLGRSVCGWLCPFGFVSDLFSRISPAPRISLSPKWLYLKYFVLAGLLTAPIWTSAIFCRFFCQSGFWLGLLPYYLTTGRPDWAGDLSASFNAWTNCHIFFGLFFLLGLILLNGRWFCRYLCPLGAWYGLFNRIAMVSVIHEQEKCTQCTACRKACPMGVDLRNDNFLNRSNCISCGRCTRLCNARHFRIQPFNPGSKSAKNLTNVNTKQAARREGG